MAKRANAVFKELSATDSGIADVRSVAEEAKGTLRLTGRYVVSQNSGKNVVHDTV